VSTGPTVSVQVLNLNGRENLDACLSSLEAQVYPRDRFEIVLVDNASTDGSAEFVRGAYPRVGVFGLETSLARGAAHNAAIRRSASRFVALLNSDARVDPSWLSELVSAAERHDAVAVASKIVDWEGKTVEFAGGATSCVGHSWAADAGEPATRVHLERPLLFASAESALFSRAAFVEAAGFDEDFADRLGDVDLGWRLNLYGGRVVLAPQAVTYRRPKRASSSLSPLQRLRLRERNALAMIYKNYEEATLAGVLPVAVALCLLRGLELSGIDTLKLPFGAIPPDSVEVDPRLIAHLIALEDFGRGLAALGRKRAAVQQRRRRPDLELFELFTDSIQVFETPCGGLVDEVAHVLIRDFGLDRMFGARQLLPRSNPAAVPAAAGSPPAVMSPDIPTELPSVSIVILTALGATHLRECLDSLRGQTYPGDRTEVIIVDNGSADDPTGEILARFPAAKVIRNKTNVGFAAANNQGAAVATGVYVVFLNDDTRVHPDWLHHLVETARRRRSVAVSSYILDWTGTSVDFVEGAVNFEAKGFQLKHGMSSRRVAPEERPLLFACGCAMLVDRVVLADAGGWDEGTFAYYEDVELGWRLHMLGHQVWLAPGAIVYHKHHGTSGQWPSPPRIRLAERNSLRALYRLLEGASLQRALPAALLLAADRALLETGLSRAADVPRPGAFRRLVESGKSSLRMRGVNKTMTVGEILVRVWSQGLLDLARDVRRLWAARESPSGRAVYDADLAGAARREGPVGQLQALPAGGRQSIPIGVAAALCGVYEFLADLPDISRGRAALQRRRRATDLEILKRFGTHWLSPCAVRLQPQHTAMHSSVVAAFALDGVDLPDACVR
jgi:GT2 family glycosyltransferase